MQRDTDSELVERLLARPLASHHTDLLREAADRIAALMARCEELERENVEARRQRDLAEVKRADTERGISAITAENERLRAALADLRLTAELLRQNALACVEHHHGISEVPPWLVDTRASIDRARAILNEVADRSPPTPW